MRNNQKVFWTEAEKAMVVAQAIEVRQWKLPPSPLDLFREAQKVLPENRQRKVRAIAEVPWFEEMVNASLSERRSSQAKSDPSISIMRDGYAVQQKFLAEILLELRELTDVMREVGERVSNQVSPPHPAGKP